MALLLVMGIPASGKSTFRRKIQTAHRELLESTSFDDFRMMRTRSSDKNARQTRKSFECHVESCISESTSKIYVIEDIFYLKSMRHPFQKIAKRHGLQFGIIFLKVGIVEALRRNSHRTGIEKQKNETIRKIFEKMEDPDEILENSIVLETDEVEIDVEVVMNKLKFDFTAKKPIVPEVSLKKSHIQKPPPPSKLESLDVLTRRLVSELMQNDKTMNGRKLSDARKKLLIDLSGNLEISNENDPKFLYDLKLKLIEFYDK
ncbi:Phosphoryl Seryl-TRNA (Ser/Sec) Kinase [Caenorhabditis elegans]|uniref:Phosphoryl Seryl-TRNA (Ser/Sec) Kinase n=1 Tax=Caenorhabditis elegans TaxID=6239 RepID=Q9XTU1_CAEEL|nr:Phosphoryl Seryl-TRNA (Ser/Sec) Kinase [Caenorhabditis elegans]CAB11556.2 Phosphoryl Seryl-TRNA (Ser/Sec) Kinase [Caenorhabditis elegans]|eukprot:NP_499627.1 Phosphoryl Seryl-TRNA (Ser/Sec) Kinase [Caenorhabditis elegans]